MKLRTTIRAASAAVITLGVGLGFTAAAGADGSSSIWSQTHSQALFVETDASSGNTILSYHRASDGTISFDGSFATGGFGASATNIVNGVSKPVADPLASQGGLTLVNNNQELIAVNAGSNTVTVFSVDGTQLTPIQRISSGGLFPVSVASNGRFVTVLNAGGAGSVAEFALFGGRLSPLPGQVRSLGLGGVTPPDFHHGAGEVAYTPNGNFLIIATKLSTNGYDVFSVAPNGALGATPAFTPAVNALPFSFVFDSAGNVVATEASNSSVTTYSVNTNGKLTEIGTVPDGQGALCWISGANGYFYGSNAGSGTVSSFDEIGGVPQLVNATAAIAHAGTIDSAISPDGNVLYVESGGAGTIDAYAIGAGGTLTQIETIFNIPVASEGIAAS